MILLKIIDHIKRLAFKNWISDKLKANIQKYNTDIYEIIKKESLEKFGNLSNYNSTMSLLEDILKNAEKVYNDYINEVLKEKVV